MQVITAVVAGASVAAGLFPLLCFARQDWALCTDVFRSEDARRRDPYALPPRRLAAVIRIALDHFLPLPAIYTAAGAQVSSFFAL